MAEWIEIENKVVSVPVYWSKEDAEADPKGAGIMEKCECSICGYRTNFTGYKKIGIEKRHNFCPNCGADMRAEQTEPQTVVTIGTPSHEFKLKHGQTGNEPMLTISTGDWYDKTDCSWK